MACLTAYQNFPLVNDNVTISGHAYRNCPKTTYQQSLSPSYSYHGNTTTTHEQIEATAKANEPRRRKNSNVKLITRRFSENYEDKRISNGRNIRKRSKLTNKRKRKYQRHNETNDDATGNNNEQSNDDNVKKHRKKTRGTDTRNTTTVHTNKYNYKQPIQLITTIYKCQQTKKPMG
jgi:hypothetical protein